MLPSKQICPHCGSDDMIMNGRFGSGGTWVCRECGGADVALESEPGEDDDLEMPMKKSKFIGGDSEDLNESAEFDDLDSGVNLIKANRVKTAKVSKVSKISKASKTKAVKGRKKK